MTDPAELVRRLRAEAEVEGFLLCGVAPAIASDGFSQLVQWIDAGYAGSMSYLDARRDAYRHPEGVLEGVTSLVTLAMPYDADPPVDVAPGAGRVARYAWSGEDYHDVIHPKLKRLGALISDHKPTARWRGVVDTAPLLEREIAWLAGLGWRGKNTLLLNRTYGSYFFLACLLTDLELPLDQRHDSSHCGTCTACLDACPTDAFPQPGVLDASRCISYLTIEHREAIPLELREPIGDWLFGCDVCQEVCPWNRKPARRHEGKADAMSAIKLDQLFELDEGSFRDRFRRTPLWRTRRRGILRNAAIVLGNQRSPDAIPSLAKGIRDEEPIVRGASAWALGQIATSESRRVLSDQMMIETDRDVQREIEQAMGNFGE